MSTIIEKYPSLEEYYNSYIERDIDNCTLCGDCIKNCTLLSQSSVKDLNPQDVIRKIIDFLKHGKVTQEVFEKVYLCSSCGVCSESCPEDIDVLVLFEAAKMKLARLGKIPEAVHSVMGVYTMWKVLTAIQTKPSEARWLYMAPPAPEKVENVIFLGCTFPAFPHMVFPLLDILDRLKVDYVALAGGDLCCGFPLGPASGLVDESEKKIKELVSNIRSFSPKKVILPCPGCYRLFTEIYRSLKFIEMDFEVQYFTDFLNEYLEINDFVNPVNKKIVLHDSCMSRRTKVNKSTAELLKKIPGLKISKAKDICCGGTPMLTTPQVVQTMGPEFIKNLSNEVHNTGSDYLSNICQLCDMTFFPCMNNIPFELRHIQGLINISMGGREYENKWLQLWKCRSLDELIELTRDNFEKNNLPEQLVREVLRQFFHLS